MPGLVRASRKNGWVTEPLLAVDATATATPPADAVAAWAGGQRVFVSSVMNGMTAERRAVVDAVEATGAEPVWFEGFGGRDDDAETAYLAEVASSTVFVGILGQKYGRLLPSRRSATHEEYREAERRGLRITAWARADDEFGGDQAEFLDEIRRFHTTGRYTGPSDLADGVSKALGRLAAEELSPWCLAGGAAFRAGQVDDDGTRITVTASVRDPKVLAALERLRPGQWGNAPDTWITWAGRSARVRAETVTTTTTASHATGIRLVLARSRSRSRDDNSQGLHAFSYTENGVTHGPDDLTALALRRAIFRDEPARASLFGMVDLGDPLGRIPTGLPSDSYTAVAGLVVTDALADTGRADRVTVRVVPPGPGGRLAVVEWTGRGTPGGRVEGTIPT